MQESRYDEFQMHERCKIYIAPLRAKEKKKSIINNNWKNQFLLEKNAKWLLIFGHVINSSQPRAKEVNLKVATADTHFSGNVPGQQEFCPRLLPAISWAPKSSWAVSWLHPYCSQAWWYETCHGWDRKDPERKIIILLDNCSIICGTYVTYVTCYFFQKYNRSLKSFIVISH